MADNQGEVAVVLHHRPVVAGDGWCFPEHVSVMRIAERSQAQELLAGLTSNGKRCALIDWGQDLEGNQLLGQSEPTVAAADNSRVRKALGLSVRYFRARDVDGDVYWFIVAVNPGHAEEILRRNCDAFGQEGVAYDQAKITWEELTDEQAGAMRCHRDDAVEAVPLSQCHLGEAFSSEW